MPDDSQDPLAAPSLIRLLDERASAAPFLIGGKAPLSYAALLDTVQAAAAALAAAGLGRHDRVAVVMPNAPAAVTTLLAVLACATAAPLSPALSAAELRFALTDLRVKAVVVPAGAGGPARAVAAERGIPVVETEDPHGTGAVVLKPTATDLPAPAGTTPAFAEAGDTALVLHTSGTTARPKIMPLTQEAVCLSAGAVARVLGLSVDDRCLVLMPLFHVHGLIGCVLAVLASGGSLCCPRPFDPLRFVPWLSRFRPTWYSAVPSIHQAVLPFLARQGAPAPLRLVRSCSAPLPPRLMAQVEAVLGVPVIEAYGMTEAAHQVSSNPLPPGERRPGSVGFAAGPRVAVMDPDGRTLLGPGRRGEVVIRGPGVMQGYEDAPEANAAAFADGWLRTGDEGVLDADGRLTLTGRFKEQINRGGQKVSPLEVDLALQDHAAVDQAVTFAVPDPLLGEEVAAAVVLRPGAEASARDLRRHCGDRLADYKVPRRICFVAEIPRGRTGKPLRRELARLLADAAPSGDAERRPTP